MRDVVLAAEIGEVCSKLRAVVGANGKRIAIVSENFCYCVEDGRCGEAIEAVGPRIAGESIDGNEVVVAVVVAYVHAEVVHGLVRGRAWLGHWRRAGKGWFACQACPA